MKITRIIYTVMFLSFVISGCISRTMPGQEGSSNLDFFPQNMTKSDIVEETSRLNKIVNDPTPDIKQKAEAHRRLAILYLIPANPDRNPQNAVEELGKFVELSPQSLDKAEASDWVLALKSATEFREMLEKNQRLSANNVKIEQEKVELAEKNLQLSKEKEELTKANLELNKIIDKIKKLDLSLEQKRRNVLR